MTKKLPAREVSPEYQQEMLEKVERRRSNSTEIKAVEVFCQALLLEPRLKALQLFTSLVHFANVCGLEAQIVD